MCLFAFTSPQSPPFRRGIKGEVSPPDWMGKKRLTEKPKI